MIELRSLAFFVERMEVKSGRATTLVLHEECKILNISSGILLLLVKEHLVI